MAESTVHVAALFIEIHIPSSGSLKSKRMVLKSLKDKLRPCFNISLAEIDHHDKWQRSLLGVCVIAQDKRHIESELRQVLSVVEGMPDLEILKDWIEFF